MKIKFKMILALAFLFGLAFAFVPKAHAQDIRSADNLVIAKNETVSSSLAANGSTINIEGTVDGDLYCFGSEVIISGRVNGDVFCAAQAINISGRVSGSVRLLASDVNLSGTTAGSVSVLSQNLILTDKGNIGQDLVTSSSKVRLNGSIGRDVSAYSQILELGGYVGRNVSARVTDLTINPSADIRGNVRYTSNNDAIRMSNSKVSGQVVRTPIMNVPSTGNSFVAVLVGAIGFMLSLLLVSMLSIWALPKFFASTNKEIESSIGKTSLYGLANLILVPIVLFVLFSTLIGIPLAGLVAVAWVLSLILCGPVTAYYLGTKLLKGKKTGKNEYLVMLIGSVIILALYFIPLVNVIVGAIVAILGSGAIMARFKHLNARSKKA